MLLLAVHLAATAAMGGLIWFVQIVHYPLFDRADRTDFPAFERDHQQRTAFVVGPLMGLEALTALLLLAVPPDGLGRALPIAGLALLGIIHLSTISLQVPAHERLARGHDPQTTRRLVTTNWIRTVGWSARTVLAAAMIIAVT
ncbi:MAG: hypothetical protein ACKOBG_11940 [Actinomycetota bacterium]